MIPAKDPREWPTKWHAWGFEDQSISLQHKTKLKPQKRTGKTTKSMEIETEEEERGGFTLERDGEEETAPQPVEEK